MADFEGIVLDEVAGLLLHVIILIFIYLMYILKKHGSKKL